MQISLEHNDTITAISTPLGVGGIGIVRVSGPLAEAIGWKIFKPGKPLDACESHRLYYGDLVAMETGAVIDEVLITLMRKPHSYTGQDVLEIHCHGGPAIMQAILSETQKAGARQARPGEFTERAYLNGRLDLIQAEAVMDMIQAQTEGALMQALCHLKGGLSEKLQALRSEILDLLAFLEASIDFPEDDTTLSPAVFVTRIESVAGQITSLLATYREGKLLRDGMTAVIVGKSNVGKSSLLNRLLEEERAIVTPIAGTTRDFIAETIHIKGLPVKLIDTAGIRDSADEIERRGIDRVWEKLAAADLILLVLDGSASLDDHDKKIISRVEGKRIIAVVNKNDLPRKLSEEDIHSLLPEAAFCSISAKYGAGIGDLREDLGRAATEMIENRHAETVIANLRHKEALEKAGDLLEKVIDHVRNNQSPEFAAVDLREAFAALGELVGESTSDEVLERIFSTFCIGK